MYEKRAKQITTSSRVEPINFALHNVGKYETKWNEKQAHGLSSLFFYMAKLLIKGLKMTLEWVRNKVTFLLFEQLWDG